MWLCLFQRDAQLFRTTEHEHKPHLWFPVGGQKRRTVQQGKAKGQQTTEKKQNIHWDTKAYKKVYMPELARDAG